MIDTAKQSCDVDSDVESSFCLHAQLHAHKRWIEVMTAVQCRLWQLFWHGMCRRKFPLHISQDGSHEETRDAARSFLPRVRYLSHYELEMPVPRQRKENIAYYRIANHYKFIMRTFFDCFQFPRIIILEVRDWPPAASCMSATFWMPVFGIFQVFAMRVC